MSSPSAPAAPSTSCRSWRSDLTALARPPRPTEPTLAPVSLAAALALALALAAAGRWIPALDLGVRRPALAAAAAVRAALAPDAGHVARETFEAERAARRLAEARLVEALRTLGAVDEARAAAGEGAWVAAPAWGLAPTPATRRILIGRSDGLRLGAAVAASSGDTVVLVGRIVEVHAGGGVALAVTDPASAVPVRVTGHGAGGVLLQGAYPGPGGRLLHVPVGARVAAGAEVRTAPGIPDLPGGVLVGYVTRVEPGDGDFLDVRVAIPVALGDVRAVLVARAAPPAAADLEAATEAAGP